MTIFLSISFTSCLNHLIGTPKLVKSLRLYLENDWFDENVVRNNDAVDVTSVPNEKQSAIHEAGDGRKGSGIGGVRGQQSIQ